MLYRNLMVMLVLVSIVSGCQSSMFGRRFQQTVGYREGDSARENPANQTSDPWIRDAGTIARQEHQTEPVNDPLNLRRVFVSQKAQDIERNLGVGD